MTYFIMCSHYRCGPFATKEAAERRLATIEKAGNCPLLHVVEPGQ